MAFNRCSTLKTWPHSAILANRSRQAAHEFGPAVKAGPSRFEVLIEALQDQNELMLSAFNHLPGFVVTHEFRSELG